MEPRALTRCALALVSALGGSSFCAAAAAPPPPSSRFLLEPLAFERLPVGSIRPTGWLRDQLHIAAEEGSVSVILHLIGARAKVPTSFCFGCACPPTLPLFLLAPGCTLFLLK